MHRGRLSAAVLAVVVLGAGAVLAVPDVASADGATSFEAKCSGIPIVGSTTGSMIIDAADDVDPVVSGGTVNNTIRVPIPVGDVPISVSIKEIKITAPIPAGVTVTAVTFTSSSFPTATWSVNGSNLIATFTGSVALGGGAPVPKVPDLKVRTTVGGSARTVQWKVPSSVTLKATGFGSFTVTCAPTAPNTVMLSTTVRNANQPPTATDQTVPVAHNTATAIKLSGTDPESSPLSFSVTSSPAHGVLSGTAPNLTYTPASGYVGPDSFTFSASDGSLSDSGTITLNVAATATTVPGQPVITGASVVREGAAKVTWSPPANTGGSPITRYVVTAVQGGVSTPLGSIAASARSAESSGLTNGVPVTFTVAAVNAIGTGPAATSGAVTPQWWLPWSSGSVAVTELFTWMTGKPPTPTERSVWLSQLNDGTERPGDLVVALRLRADATTNVDPTVRLYSAYLTRVPDAGGLNYWLARRRAGWTLSKISSNFAGSSEFKRRYGSLTNRAFVENIYKNVLERKGDKAGIDFWTRRLDQRKASRGQVMINFSESNEYKNKQVDNTNAAVVYIHVLGKTPTLVQRDQFIADMAEVGLSEAVRQHIHQPAFDARAG